MYHRRTTITLICLWGHRECTAAKTAPSMLAAVFDNGLQETSRSRRRYRPEHVTPTKRNHHHHLVPSGSYIGICRASETRRLLDTLHIPNLQYSRPIRKKNLGTRCALRTRHYSRIDRLTGYWAQICNPLFHFDILFLDVDPLRSARRTRHGSQVYLIMCGAILQLQVEDQWTLS